jgi:hypothetical protein
MLKLTADWPKVPAPIKSAGELKEEGSFWMTGIGTTLERDLVSYANGVSLIF